MVWFNLPAYMKGRMPDGERVVMHGRVSEAPDARIWKSFILKFIRWTPDAPPAVRPVYGLPSEIGQRVYAGAGRASTGGARRANRRCDAGRVAR